MLSETVIEVARRAAGLSQRRLADIARTQQSSISEYERRRKSPTLDVVERLVDAANHQLVAKPIVFWETFEDPEVGKFGVPDKLWSVPIPDCFAPVQILRFLFEMSEDRTFDLSDPEQRIEYYELALRHGLWRTMEDSVDGLLLIQAWPRMNLPEVIRTAWQPLIDAATAPQKGPPRDPGGLSAQIAVEIGIEWPPRKRRHRRSSDRFRE